LGFVLASQNLLTVYGSETMMGYQRNNCKY